jgi:hypothetical protein
MNELDIVKRRAGSLSAIKWCKLWAGAAKRAGLPCYNGNQFSDWDTWAQEIAKLPKDVPAKLALLDAIERSEENSLGNSPGFSIEYDYTFGTGKTRGVHVFTTWEQFHKDWVSLFRKWNAVDYTPEQYDEWLASLLEKEPQAPVIRL